MVRFAVLGAAAAPDYAGAVTVSASGTLSVSGTAAIAGALTHGEQLTVVDVGPAAGGYDTLTTHSGNFFTSSNGQTVEGLNITGEVFVNHPGVDFLGCKMRRVTVSVGAGTFTLEAEGGDSTVRAPGDTRPHLRWCELDGGSNPGADPAVKFNAYLAYRCYAHNWGEVFRGQGSTSIVECYAHDYIDYISQQAHQDFFQIAAGSRVEVLRCHSIANDRDTGAYIDGFNGTIQIGSGEGGTTDVYIRDNYGAGGSYVYRGGSAAGFNYTGGQGEEVGPTQNIEFLRNIAGQDLLERASGEGSINGLNYGAFADIDPASAYDPPLANPTVTMLDNRWGPAGPNWADDGVFPQPNQPIGAQS